MRSSKRLGIMIGACSLLITILMLVGIGYAIKDQLFPSVSVQPQVTALPEQTAEKNQLRIVAIGDSLTKGVGDSAGGGYVKQVVDSLAADPDKQAELVNNLGISGLRADQLAENLKTDKGIAYALQQANVILLTIGGNDLFQSLQGAQDSNGTAAAEPNMSLAQVEKGLEEGLKRLDNVLSELHRINPEARVIYIGLYNPFFDVKELRDGSLEVQKWNEKAYDMLHEYSNMTMVPTFDLFEERIGSYLSSDHFHPNHEGYKQIAQRVVQAL
ncbi:GDSL family lipase [Paenibacillus sp. BIHB 4019]|uniref:GDSL family lipase n=1 Tax=Paenibacillus sp. BIHB 4019 TaxID=1870819 RepID=A0A1B2DMK5_9BACL|nr:GDSL-type esterase/lipase family protein [Paenibacillus sp. BIHB 4019]ANY68944.1 GDSL family lipase [Paenibacillus sp. BIHB 4019]